MRRRRFLAVVGAGTVGVAGCSSNDGPATTDETTAGETTDDETTTQATTTEETTRDGTTGDGTTEETTDEETTTEEERENLTPISWDDEDDWDLSEAEHNVVHEPWTPAGNKRIQLGYPSYDPTERKLVAYWPMNDENDKMTDVAYGHNGNHDDVIPAEDGPFGKRGKRYNAGASSQVPDGKFSTRDRVTLNIWFRMRSETGTNPIVFLNDALDAVALDDGRIRVNIGSGSKTYSLYIPRNEWSYKDIHMLTIVFTGTRLFAYVDGDRTEDIIARLRDPISRRERAFAPLKNTDDGEIARGDVYDVRLYDRAFDHDEVADLYDAAYEGTLETASKSFTAPAKPHLQQLEYTLNDGAITLTVVGSPGDDAEERVSVGLDGADEYDLDWEREHEEFSAEITLESDDGRSSPWFGGFSLDQ